MAARPRRQLPPQALAASVSVDLPYPPSANRLWRSVPGKKTPLISAEYRRWMAQASALVALTMRGKIVDGPYGLTLLVGRPDNRKRDIDNLIKPVNDVLKHGGAVRDDSDCQMLTARWAPNIEGIRVLVMATRRTA